MKKYNTFTILFYIKRNQINRKGEAPIMTTLSVNGERATFSAKLSVNPDIWDAKSGRAIGRTAKIADLNSRLTDLQLLLKRHYYEIEQRHGYVTVEMIRNAYMGLTTKAESIIPLYKDFLEGVRKMVGISRSDKTYQKYERCYRRVVEFMETQYNISDLPLRELKPKFLLDFEVFLATKYKCSHNTIYKFLQLFRMVLLKARREGISFADPYLGYKMKQETVDRGYLTEEEVVAIATKDISIKRLDQVRDVFVFACYTGLAYADIAMLRADNIKKMFDGKLWIVTRRRKTKANVNVPLLPIAEKILTKYEGKFQDGKILPILSNQKMNAYLKEIGDICEIEKKITFHLARHTFATTITLSKGVPIESVSKMLGHANIKTTQIYARITNDKISKDMENLAQNLGPLNF